jgi:hypothetical protein
MEGTFPDPLGIVVVCGVPFWILTIFCGLAVRDRRARTDAATLVLSSLTLLANLGICIVVGLRYWCFWPSAVALGVSALVVGLCLRARFA